MAALLARDTFRSRCARCGENWIWFGQRCGHPENCRVLDMGSHEAERVKTRYAFGKRYNPDHDTTSYRDREPAASKEEA